MKVVINIAEGQKTVTFSDMESMEGERTFMVLSRVFAQCLLLANRKGQTYGMAWSEQGYMGNVGRVLSKVSRLRNMVWRDLGINDSEESVWDTLLDLVNLAAFALYNYEEGNKWGDRNV